MTERKKLRTGFTTGTCAQAAAKAAMTMLATGRPVKAVGVLTPNGTRLKIKVIDQKIGKSFARCAVVKDSGDDPDVTDGIRVCARVRYSGEKGIRISGGAGVGMVTKPGLAIKPGECAINPTPREMITRDLCAFIPNGKGAEVVISVPGGHSLARKTFNSRLGIVGGISIIGTTGIVEPRSTDAYKKSLALNLDVVKAAGYNKVVLVLGYVGEKFCREKLSIDPESIIKIGDHVGFMLTQCANKGIKKVLLVGHIGKLIKVANGQFDTNIKFGDGRLDTIARFAKLCGARGSIVKEISAQVSADATIGILRKAHLTKTFDMIAKRAVDAIDGLVKGKLSVTCILLSLSGEKLSAYPKKRWTTR